MGFRRQVKGKLINSLMEIRIKTEGSRVYEAMLREAERPREVQEDVLLKILKTHENTYFGKVHGFKDIETLADFRKQVPVNDYESLRSWVDSQDLTGRPAMNPDFPSFYAMTSGTTGTPKYIPVLKTALKAHKRIMNLFVYRLLHDRPKALKGHILAIVSPAIEGYRPDSGTSFGSTSGHMYAGMPKLVRKKYIVPAPLFGIEDYDLKYLLILRLALKYRDVSYLTTANPSTVVRLLKLLNSNWDKLYRDLKEGTFYRMDELTSAQKRALVGRLGPRKRRAEELNEIYSQRGELRLKDLFPDLQALGCWTGGSCSIFFDQLKGQIPEGTLIRDIGYLSSEFRGTVPLSNDSNAGVPTFRDYFFEFADKDDWDIGRQKFLCLHELEDRKQYYIFVTTDSGLYRYNMNDIVEVDGFFKKVPKFRFVQKGKGVTNITGEKLYESQVITALSAAEQSLGLQSSFYMTFANEDESRYQLYFEPKSSSLKRAIEKKLEFSRTVEDQLQAVNVEYQVKRKSGRLSTIEVLILAPGTFEEYKKFCLRQGQRESQFKIVALQYRKDQSFSFDHHVIESTLMDQLKEAARQRAIETSFFDDSYQDREGPGVAP